jgi:RHS repeat-associated protein
MTQIVYPGGATSTFGYNGLDTRTSKNGPSGVRNYLRDGAYVTDPVVQDGWAVYTPTISQVRSGTVRYNHSGLKSMDVQSTASQTISSTIHRDAFGNQTSINGAWTGPFGYAGGFGYQQHSDSGLMLLGHRYYDPSTGRFLTRDPIKDGRNWYGYGGGDGAPTGFVDPEGYAKIYLAWRPVAGVGNHLYLIVECENTGNTWTIGGGPQNNGIIPGNLVDKSGPSGGGNYEGLKPRTIPPGAILIRDDNLPAQYWFDKGNNIGGEIDARGYGYNPLGRNSNAFLWTILVRAGLLDDWIGTGRSGDVSGNASTMAPRGAVWAPGWGLTLPR